MMGPDGVWHERPIVREVSVDRSQGIVVRGWRATEEGLLLRTLDQAEEVRLKCVCGRCHWIVREQHTPDGVRLLVTCHGCGTRGSLRFQAAPLPAR